MFFERDGYLYEVTKGEIMTNDDFDNMTHSQMDELVRQANQASAKSGDYEVRCVGRTPESQFKRGMGFGALIVLAIHGVLSILSKLFK